MASSARSSLNPAVFLISGARVLAGLLLGEDPAPLARAPDRESTSA